MNETEGLGYFFLVLCYVFPVALFMWITVLSLLFTGHNYRKLKKALKQGKKAEVQNGCVAVGLLSLVASMSFAVAIYFVILLARVLMA